MAEITRPDCVIQRALHMVIRYDLHSQYVFIPCCVATVLFRLNMQLPCNSDVDESIVAFPPKWRQAETERKVASQTKRDRERERFDRHNYHIYSICNETFRYMARLKQLVRVCFLQCV